MTSPYLDKPSRSIQKALDDCGMTASDIGLDEKDLAGPAHGFATKYRFFFMAAICLFVVFGVISFSNIYNTSSDAEIATAEDLDKISDELSNIMPAAGN